MLMELFYFLQSPTTWICTQNTREYNCFLQCSGWTFHFIGNCIGFDTAELNIDRRCRLILRYCTQDERLQGSPARISLTLLRLKQSTDRLIVMHPVNRGRKPACKGVYFDKWQVKDCGNLRYGICRMKNF